MLLAGCLWCLVPVAMGQFPDFSGGEEEGEAEMAEPEVEAPPPMVVPSDLMEVRLTPRTEGTADRFARIFSVDLRDIEEKQSEILAALEYLPVFPEVLQRDLFGYHSGSDRKRTKWVQVDLGEVVEPDAVVLFPATVTSETETISGYGFPRRFRIDISEDPTFADYKYETIVDHRSDDEFQPKQTPFFQEMTGFRGRYVRVTALTLWTPTGGSSKDEVFALGELMVLKGERNIAATRPVTAMDTLPESLNQQWARRYLTDSRTPLGIPQDVRESPSHGYRCETREKVTERWVQIDLEESLPVSEIRLIPALPSLVPDPGVQFPARFRVEISDSPDMRQADAIVKFPGGQPARPENNPVILSDVSGYGRYVRLTVERPSPGPMAFALAEMQVFSDDENVALGKTVTAEETAKAEGWAPEFLVDGFSSRSGLISYGEYLTGLANRGRLMGEWRSLDRKRLDLVDGTLAKIVRWAAGGTGGVFLFIILALARGRSRRQQDIEALRQQIASDLHDDIGSNLSSIALLAELGWSEVDEPEIAREEFEEIKKTADKTVESMRDIVWLIRPGEETWKQLLARFRETAAKLLKAHVYQFDARGHLPDEKLPLDFKRDFFLIYKEVLNNIVRHAEARRVNIEFETRRGRLMLRVTDDGKGFNNLDQNFQEGNGLRNLRRRAQAIGASLKVRSASGEGTSVTLTASMP
ncbi:MAG: hypothetical protein KDM91_22135 [Verrucomicrobiae bacterium]|nr:hypothetical protein [Verrucomicrobiae bacterium]MCP5540854.1 hypothetical protein [Akkermansiaceae bacterium]